MLAAETVTAKCIIFVEPHCVGFEHVPFNSALIDVIERSYPGARILRVAEASHLENLAKVKPTGFQAGQGVGERNKVILPHLEGRRSSFGAQVVCALRALLFIDSLARSERAELVVFSSMNANMYALLRLARLVAPAGYLSIVFFHHAFHDIRHVQRNIIKRWFSLRHQLNRRIPNGVKIAVLGGSIARNAGRFLNPAAAAEILSMDHPYPMEAIGVSQKKPPDRHGIITLSYVGVARSGFESFCKIAMQMKDEKRFSFLHIGKGTPSDIRMAQNAGVIGTREKPLSKEEMDNFLAKTTYIVGTAPPERYELSASGTFLDGISRGIPGIYLRNDYVEYYFKKLGDIGYMCNSLDEMVNVIFGLGHNFSGSRYEHQVSAINSGRELFSADTVSKSFSDITGPRCPVNKR